MIRTAILLVLVAALVVSGYVYFTNSGHDPGQGPGADKAKAPLVEISLPEALSADARIGRQTFDAKCASCHGANAVGQDGVAPPLIHMIYEPGHHGDESFQRAVAMGVRAHHWPFGDMPAVKGLTRRDVTKVVAYIRELQRVNGID